MDGLMILANFGASVNDYIQSVVLFVFLTVLANWIAWKLGFYRVKLTTGERASFPCIKHVLLMFITYLGILMVFPALVSRLVLFAFGYGTLSSEIVSVLHTLIIVAASVLVIVIPFQYNKEEAKKIWKVSGKNSIFFDLGLGFLTWLVGFPVIALVGQLSDMFIFFVLRSRNYEQAAVSYLKSTFESPIMLFTSIFTVLIIAPVIEEFLFRGILQSWFKRFVTPWMSIIFTSICFALFHISPDPGWGNLSLITSLFTFSCFLGFVKERQSSLFAAIGLHMAFNGLSTIRILMNE